MVVGLRQKLYTAGRCQLLKAGQNLRGIQLQLLQQNAGYAKGDLKPAPVFFDQFQQQQIRRQVAFLGYLFADLLVLSIVEVIAVLVEDGVVSESAGLMNLKVEAYRCHEKPKT